MPRLLLLSRIIHAHTSRHHEEVQGWHHAISAEDISMKEQRAASASAAHGQIATYRIIAERQDGETPCALRISH